MKNLVAFLFFIVGVVSFTYNSYDMAVRSLEVHQSNTEIKLQELKNYDRIKTTEIACEQDIKAFEVQCKNVLEQVCKKCREDGIKGGTI